MNDLMQAEDRILFAAPDIGDEEIQAVVECLRSGWLTTGPVARQFEAEFAQMLGVDYAIAVNSCTAALHLGLEAFGVSTGDKVAVPVMTFTATAEVVRYLGADPIFVDVDAESSNMSVDALEAVLSNEHGVKAIVPVHYAGLAADLPRIGALAGDYGCRVLEDAAHAFPATSHGRKIGGISDATAFSFYATKTITSAEGGMLTTNDPAIADRVRTMRLHGISRDVFDRYRSTTPAWYYEVVAPGYKYNLPDMLAAVGRVQLARAEVMRLRRQAIAERYREAFVDLPVDLPNEPKHDEVHSWHLFVLRIRSGQSPLSRNEFISAMATAGIGTSVHFIPLHLQPYWRDRFALTPEQFPVATSLYSRIVSLPIFSAMSDGQVDRVISNVRRLLASRG